MRCPNPTLVLCRCVNYDKGIKAKLEVLFIYNILLGTARYVGLSLAPVVSFCHLSGLYTVFRPIFLEIKMRRKIKEKKRENNKEKKNKN